MSTPAAANRTRTYSPTTHRFFDDLVVFLATLSSNLVVAEALRSGGHTKVVADPKYYMQFEGCSLGVELTWYPQETLMAIAANTWPSQIVLYENLVHPRAPVLSLSSTGAKNLHSLSLQSCFLRYFETNRPTIEARFGKDPSAWPPAWNFARVVRNAFAHGGLLTFQNASAQAVSWQGLTYGPSRQGRQLIFQDMSFVEVVALLEELDALL